MPNLVAYIEILILNTLCIFGLTDIFVLLFALAPSLSIQYIHVKSAC